MRWLISISLCFLLCSGFSQTTGKKTVFGVGLFTSAHSNMITYAIITLRNGAIEGAQVVSEQQFMYQAMGYYPSIANINKENLFQKYGVDSCFLLKNDYNKISGYYCKPFKLLWKLRFFENPYEFDTPGWSQGQHKPSIYQMKILREEYGVTNILTDFFYGDTLFKLLRDVQDPAWVSSYRFATKDSTDTDTTGSNP